MTDRDGNQEMYAMNADGRPRSGSLTTHPADAEFPIWRP